MLCTIQAQILKWIKKVTRYHCPTVFQNNLTGIIYFFFRVTVIYKLCFSYSDHEAIMVELSITRDSKSTRCYPDEAAKKLVLEECIELCKEALKSISRTKVLYWLGIVILLVLIAISLILPAVLMTRVFDEFPTLFGVLRVIFTALMLFCFLMATLWSRIEMHGVLSGKLAMEVSLKKIKQQECL